MLISYVDKVAPFSSDLSKLSDLVKIEDVEKDMSYKLVKKSDAIDTSRLVNKTNYNAKIKEIEDKILIITNLATTVALTAVEKMIPNVSTLVENADNDAAHREKIYLLLLIIINFQIIYSIQN